jgi:glycosyltransferase involved in cell wall biosynthesis
MTITIVIPFVNLTGGIRVVLEYANWLHDEGHDVVVVYPLWPYRFHFDRRDQLIEFRRQWREPARIDWFSLRCRLERVPFVSNAFLRRADVVAVTSWPAVHHVARLHASRGAKVHLLFHHESGTGPEQRIRQTYRLPFRRVAFSARVQAEVEARFACDVHERVPAGVDARVFFADGEPTGDTVLMLYHDDPRKGAEDGIAALARLRARLPHLTVRMCGTVPPRSLPSWIRFQLRPSDADLRRLYSTSAALLYPSRYEGFGLPPLEAMACGCPIVTTDVGAVAEFASDRCNALVVPPRDVDAMADRLEELLRNRVLRTALSARGLATAAQFDVSRTAPAFERALKEAVARRD